MKSHCWLQVLNLQPSDPDLLRFAAIPSLQDLAIFMDPHGQAPISLVVYTYNFIWTDMFSVLSEPIENKGNCRLKLFRESEVSMKKTFSQKNFGWKRSKQVELELDDPDLINKLSREGKKVALKENCSGL